MNVSIDAEKAFDRMEWGDEKIWLWKYNFSKWISLLHANPKASIITNNVVSASFDRHGGTRQGCSLSPLLFAIAIEPSEVYV